jgi:Fe-S-cluster-containing dehydrogenase component
VPGVDLYTFLDKCTGCNMCTLACSRLQTGGFNPRYSKIQIRQELSGYVTGIEFAGGCDRDVPTQCVEGGIVPQCVVYCLFEAIIYKRRKEHGKYRTD